MAVSDHFAAAALNVETVPSLLPCRCGQVHYGAHYRASEPVTEIKCTICRTSVRFDLTHIGALPTEDYRIFARHLPCPVTTTDAVSAGLSIIPGLRVSGRQTWRVGPGSRAPVLDNRLIGVLDAQGALLHLGYYEAGRLMRGVFLHHESGFVRYLSPRSSITYERGLVEGPLLPAFHDGNTLALVHRTFRVWRRRLLKRVVSGAPLRQRSRVSAYVH